MDLKWKCHETFVRRLPSRSKHPDDIGPRPQAGAVCVREENLQGQQNEFFTPRKEWESDILKERLSGWVNPKACRVVTALDSKSEKPSVYSLHNLGALVL
jgi:hypothetical protein